MQRLLFACAVLPLLACSDDLTGNNVTGNEAIDTSIEAWDDLHDEVSTYAYMSYVDADDSDDRWETEIYVVDDVVVERRYSHYENGALEESWTESQEEFGTHLLDLPRPTITLDVIYDGCVDSYLNDGHQDSFRFATFENGLLKDCYYPDDGVIGVRLAWIELEDEGSCVAGVAKLCG